MALIGSNTLPVCEKKLYLKSYLAGEAKKAVEGYFFRNSDQAHQGIWDVLGKVWQPIHSSKSVQN